MMVRPLEEGPCCSGSWGWWTESGPQPIFLPQEEQAWDREKALAVLLPLVQVEGPWHLICTACVAVSTRTCSSALASRMLGIGSRHITGKGDMPVKQVNSELS